MSSYHKRNKGESINPSARPSIHSHSCCPFDERHIMRRHGLIKNKFNNANTSVNRHDEGFDEVDNIMSKFAHPIQVPRRNYKKTHRRNSLEINTQDFTSDDSNILSKSLPSSLETKPCCSDDSYSDQDSTQKTDNSNESFYITNNISANEKEGEPSTKSQYSMRQNDNTLENNYVYLWLVVPVMLGIGVVYITGILDIIQNKLLDDNTVRDHNRYEQKFYNDLFIVGEKYKVNSDKILQLQNGISLVSENQDTASFMFVYNSETTNFATETVNKFVNEVASIAARYLRNGNSTVRHVVVDSSRVYLRDSTELIEKYKADVTENGVLLLMRLDTLPSSLAMALHYYCDEYNPLANKSAIFSTLDLVNCNEQKKPTHAHIEKCLAKKWHGVPADNIGPLLARVVNIVVDLTSIF